MELDWQTLDRWLMGEAWIGSSIEVHLTELCERIGPRWSSSEAEWQTINYIREQMQAAGLDRVAAEEYSLETWALICKPTTIAPGRRPWSATLKPLKQSSQHQ